MDAARLTAIPVFSALSPEEARAALDEMIAGARVEVAPYKRNATDFVLWKPSAPTEPTISRFAGCSGSGSSGK